MSSNASLASALIAAVACITARGDCIKLENYNCPTVTEVACNNSIDCFWNSEDPPRLECGSTEVRALGELLGSTTSPAPWDSGSTSVGPDGTGYCYQERACMKYCIAIQKEEDVEFICESGSGIWTGQGPYTILKETGNFCHP